jgi:hypothetical protein
MTYKIQILILYAYYYSVILLTILFNVILHNIGSIKRTKFVYIRVAKILYITSF